MKKLILIPIIFVFSCLTVYGDYTFEVVSENHDETVTEVKQADDAKVDTRNAIENYKKVMSNDNEVYIVRNQLAYNKKREKDIADEIDKLEKQLESLPKIVKREYQQFDHMLESTDDDIADNTWISFEDAFNKKKKELEDRISVLKGDLVVVRTRIAKLKLDLETLETVSNISNPFVQTTSGDSVDDKAQKALQAKNNLKDIVKQVTYKETKDLLGDVQHNTLGVCEFSCGRSNCYTCNLLYGKKTK
ncbi:MAG: hypothetical protein SCARUB_00768 [Candidatus Scalindua rubra]|uniref:Uncharacterized protein n=1 Tax=Candidatus Scalindua rubra TaxID=1872076 RepID=A0A1E3XEP0_9BACT|nr:MAG: hypothetical protein SCARUB_00768 [Candidatus Scalindua rubra]